MSYVLDYTLRNMCKKFLISLTKYISMVITIICVFLWIPNILKELCNVLYESVLKACFFINIVYFKASYVLDHTLKELCNVLYESVLKVYFFINNGFFQYPMSLTFHDDQLDSLA